MTTPERSLMRRCAEHGFRITDEVLVGKEFPRKAERSSHNGQQDVATARERLRPSAGRQAVLSSHIFRPASAALAMDN